MSTAARALLDTLVSDGSTNEPGSTTSYQVPNNKITAVTQVLTTQSNRIENGSYYIFEGGPLNDSFIEFDGRNSLYLYEFPYPG